MCMGILLACISVQVCVCLEPAEVIRETHTGKHTHRQNIHTHKEVAQDANASLLGQTAASAHLSLMRFPRAAHHQPLLSNG